MRLCPSAAGERMERAVVDAVEERVGRALATVPAGLDDGEVARAVAFALDRAAARGDEAAARGLLAHGDGRVRVMAARLLLDPHDTTERFGPAVRGALRVWRGALVEAIGAALQRSIGEGDREALRLGRFAGTALVSAIARAAPADASARCATCAALAAAEEKGRIDERAADELAWWVTSARVSRAELFVEEGLARCLRCGAIYWSARREEWDDGRPPSRVTRLLRRATPAQIEALLAAHAPGETL